MFNLLSADLYTVKKSKAVFVMILLGAAISIAFVFMLKFVVMNLPASEIGQGSNKVVMGWSLSKFDAYKFNALYLANQVFGNGDIIPLLIAIFVCMFVTGEFAHGTIRNILTIGCKKSTFYLSKLIIVCAASVDIMLSTVITTFIAGGFVFGFGTDTRINGIIDFLGILAVQAFLHMAFASLFLMIALLVKNVGGSIAISMCTVLFLSIAFAITSSTAFKSGQIISSWWLSTNIAALTAPSLTTGTIVKAVFVGFLFIAITTTLGMSIFTRQDVK